MGVNILDGDRVREQLRSLGATQLQLATAARLTEPQLSRALDGAPLDPVTVFRIAEALDRLRPRQVRA